VVCRARRRAGSFFTNQPQTLQRLAHRWNTHLGDIFLMQAIAQFGQRCVRLIQNQCTDLFEPLATEERRKTATMRLGRDGLGFSSSLQESPDKSRAHTEAIGNLRPGFKILIAGLNDTHP
jgi:hypothetical protein